MVRWFEKSRIVTHSFYFDHLNSGFDKIGLQFYITSLCQVILKNFMKLYLTFNNDIFTKSYRYGEFTQEDIAANYDNFVLIYKYTRYPHEKLGRVEDNDFKYNIPPKWSNLEGLCRMYADFREDLRRLTDCVNKFNKLTVTQKTKDVLDVFEYSGNLDELVQTIDELVGKYYKQFSETSRLEELKLEQEVIKSRVTADKSSFVLQLAGLALALLFGYK